MVLKTWVLVHELFVEVGDFLFWEILRRNLQRNMITILNQQLLLPTKIATLLKFFKKTKKKYFFNAREREREYRNVEFGSR